MATSKGIILSSLTALHKSVLGTSTLGNNNPSFIKQFRQYATRRGTREKAKKNKVKKEVKKLTFAEKLALKQKNIIIKPRAMIYQDHFRPAVESDDVYFMKYFKFKIYSFEEAINNHREFLHPTIFNDPDSKVEIFVHLNLEGVKKTKPVETFSKLVPIAHKFDQGIERKILAFCKTKEQIDEALEAGAALAGGSDIIKLITSGDISLSSYDMAVAHPSILPEVVTIRGLLKKKQPNLKNGTIGPNLAKMIYSQLHGVYYTAKAFAQFPTYGEAQIPIGRLSMDIKHLEENLQATVDSIMSARPKRPGSFITKIEVLCASSQERFVIDHDKYAKQEESPEFKKTDAIQSTEDDEDIEAEVEEDEKATAIPMV